MDAPAFVDERQDVQKKTFTKWINAQLSKASSPLVDDLFEDLRDGHKLLALLEILTNQKYKREKGRMRVHHINTVNKVLQVLGENGVKLLNISSEDIVGGNPKLTLGLISSIALYFEGRKLVNSETVSGLEKNLLRWVHQFTDKYSLKVNDFTTSWSNGLPFLYILHDFGVEFDLDWAIKQHPIARLRFVFDLATRVLRIHALLDPEDVHTNKPDKKSILMYVMCLYQAIESIRSTQLANAASIQMLDQHFEGSSEDIHSPTSETSSHSIQPSTSGHQLTESQTETHTEASNTISLTEMDEVSLVKSIEDMNNFPVQRSSTFTITKNESINLSGAETVDLDDENNKTNNFQQLIESRSRPVSTATNASVEIGGYQSAIEIVLSLLLEAEEVLSKSMPDIRELSEAKAQFQAHEEFMIKLSEYQEYVGGALEEGARLLSEPVANTGLTTDDQSEIKQQMLLLNELSTL